MFIFSIMFEFFLLFFVFIVSFLFVVIILCGCVGTVRGLGGHGGLDRTVSGVRESGCE